MKQISTILLLF